MLHAFCAVGGVLRGLIGAARSSARRGSPGTKTPPGAIDPSRPEESELLGRGSTALPRRPARVESNGARAAGRGAGTPAGPVQGSGAAFLDLTAVELGLAAHRESILSLPPDLGATDTRVANLVIRREGHLATYFAPLEPVSPDARLVLLGTTPTADVVARALRAAREALLQGLPDSEVLRAARHEALRGLRARIEDLVEALGLREIFGREPRELVESRVVDLTWALRNPVLRDGGTSTGASPRIGASEMLRSAVVVDLAEELSAVPATPVVPLGEVAAEALDLLVDLGRLESCRVLPEVPDPITANAIRMAHFRENQPALEEIRSRIRLQLVDRPFRVSPGD